LRNRKIESRTHLHHNHGKIGALLALTFSPRNLSNYYRFSASFEVPVDVLVGWILQAVAGKNYCWMIDEECWKPWFVFLIWAQGMSSWIG
jgi:hypothetical protein